ncbi:MAG: hypothetical protein SGJ19_10860 [Planctomycetia bacterium]|nr:hypothetical protein [Planctomycetia bacterium]
MPSNCMRRLIVCAAFASAISAFATDIQAAFHRWAFTEAFSNEDGSVQFIEMRTPFNGEDLMAGHALDSNGPPFAVTTDLPSNLTANKSFIFGTAAYAALPGAVTPDYLIPANFFNPAGDFLNWANNSATMTIAAGQLPLDGVLSLLKNGTTAVNSPTNFAGAIGHIDLRAPVPGDTNNDRLVNVTDLNNVRNNFGSFGPDVLGDTNNDDEVTIADLNAVRNNFGEGGGSPVPEPAGVALAALSIVASLMWMRGRRAGRSRH